MICSGINVHTGENVRVEFGHTIESVTSLPPAQGDTYLSAGFIDLQVNGFAGVDYNAPHVSVAEIGRSVDTILATGVTRFFPTVITGSPNDMVASLRNLASARDRLESGEAIAGFHVEGPHIAPEDGPRGAHPVQWVRRPDLGEYRRWQEATGGQIRLVTLSPHWDEAPRYIEAVVRDGVTVSIGHTGASAPQISEAVSAGATMSTHIGNGAHQMLKRHPNYLWDQLADDRLTAGFIADGIHLGAAFLKVALRAKGVNRALLVTDASAPAGAAPGRYRLGEQDVDFTEDGRVVLAGQDRLAGSALKMQRGIEVLMRSGELSLRDAVTMATATPARIGKIAGRALGLMPGERGDVVKFNFDKSGDSIKIKETYCSGRRVFPLQNFV